MKKLSVLTPTRDGLVDINYVRSLMATQAICEGWQIEPTMTTGNSDITKARNDLFNMWYQSDVDACLFVDSDISWQPYQFKSWLDAEYSLMAANYPKKQFNFEAFLKICNAMQIKNGHIEVGKALSASFDYVSTGEHRVIEGGDFHGKMMVRGVGMGFFYIDRDAADLLFEWAKKNMEPYKFHGIGGGKVYTGYPVFNHLNREDGKMFGEDFSFCQRLIEAGINPVIDPEMEVMHTGQTGFVGKFKDYTDAHQLFKEMGQDFPSDMLSDNYDEN